MKSPTVICILLLVTLLTDVAVAASEDGERGGRRGPPPEALEACTALVQGDACSFEGRRGDTVSGTCETPHGDELVCFPEGGPPERGRGRGPDDDT